MWMFIEEDDPEEQEDPVARLCPGLLHAIAMTELMLERWCEPPDIHRPHYSTLVQQILSVITSRGAAGLGHLEEVLLASRAFPHVTHAELNRILGALRQHDLVELSPEGEYILGLCGEEIVRGREFYAAFATSEDLQVFHQGRCIGSISAVPGLGSDGFLILAGRRWRIIELNLRSREILVEPSAGGRLPLFIGPAGPDVHPQVRARMLRILADDGYPTYLDTRARRLLDLARDYASRAGILTNRVLTLGPHTLWFTWTGSRIHRTILALAKSFAKLPVQDEDIGILFEGMSPDRIRSSFQGVVTDPPSAADIAATFQLRAEEKYDHFLPPDLGDASFALSCLDLDGALNLVRQLLGSPA